MCFFFYCFFIVIAAFSILQHNNNNTKYTQPIHIPCTKQEHTHGDTHTQQNNTKQCISFFINDVYIFAVCDFVCVCFFVSVCVIESTTLCITYYFLCLHSKERKQQSSEEAVHRPSVCLSLRWYKRVMCMLLFCAQFFEALIFAIHRYPNNMVYNTDFVYGLRDDGHR